MVEQQGLPQRDEHHAIRKQLDNALLSTFCRALDSSYLTPMTVLSAMAESLGSVYRQVADSHHAGAAGSRRHCGILYVCSRRLVPRQRLRQTMRSRQCKRWVGRNDVLLSLLSRRPRSLQMGG